MGPPLIKVNIEVYIPSPNEKAKEAKWSTK